MRSLRADPEVATIAAGKIKAISHPLRLRIVAVLSETESHVNGLADELRVPQSVISQHLRILRMEGLVGVERKEGFSIYRLLEPKIINLLNCMESCQWS